MNELRFGHRGGRPLICLLCVVPLFCWLEVGSAQAPAWWGSRGVTVAGAQASDFSPANQGQAKWMATNAFAELVQDVPGPGMEGIYAVVNGFTQQANFASLNQGQLKALAQPFYDYINAAIQLNPGVANCLPVGMTPPYPWTTSTSDYSPVNIGQLKYVFSFDFSKILSNVLPTSWQQTYFGTTGVDPNADPDGDGLTNFQEYELGTNPTKFNTDNDGMSDGLEWELGRVPLQTGPNYVWFTSN